jgi:hypothetical protein
MDPDPLTINDDALTKAGLSAASVADVSGRVMLLACGALAREILALTMLNGWSHLVLACLPAQLLNEPK